MKLQNFQIKDREVVRQFLEWRKQNPEPPSRLKLSWSNWGFGIERALYEEDPSARMILVQDKELNLLGSLMYTWADYHLAVDLIASKAVELKPLRTHHFPFERWADAYALVLHHPDEAVKVIIDLV